MCLSGSLAVSAEGSGKGSAQKVMVVERECLQTRNRLAEHEATIEQLRFEVSCAPAFGMATHGGTPAKKTSTRHPGVR